jgi:hypothetical protein
LGGGLCDWRRGGWQRTRPFFLLLLPCCHHQATRPTHNPAPLPPPPSTYKCDAYLCPSACPQSCHCSSTRPPLNPPSFSPLCRQTLLRLLLFPSPPYLPPQRPKSKIPFPFVLKNYPAILRSTHLSSFLSYPLCHELLRPRVGRREPNPLPQLNHRPNLPPQQPPPSPPVTSAAHDPSANTKIPPPRRVATQKKPCSHAPQPPSLFPLLPRRPIFHRRAVADDATKKTHGRMAQTCPIVTMRSLKTKRRRDVSAASRTILDRQSTCRLRP